MMMMSNVFGLKKLIWFTYTLIRGKYMTTSLSDKWNLWAHLPHDSDWALTSYYKVYTMETIEDTIAICETVPENMLKKCMLFIMKDGITPLWEDPKNRNGGCFSYKVMNRDVPTVWKQMTYAMTGNTLAKDAKLNATINGITISPKTSFCIIKIWMSTLSYQNPNDIAKINGLSTHGCIFKTHTPEY